MKINSWVVQRAEEGSIGLYDFYKAVIVATSSGKTEMCKLQLIITHYYHYYYH